MLQWLPLRTWTAFRLNANGKITVDGGSTFQLEAHDEHEKIAGGTHKLRVIQAARLAKKVEGKTPKS